MAQGLSERSLGVESGLEGGNVDGRETRFQGMSPGTGQSRRKNRAVLVPWKKSNFFLS